MYRQLLLSSGGGIISNTQKDKQEKCVTLAIGLGGTGIACLRNLKRQVYERLQADNPKDSIPTYSHIKFLAVDTDKSSLEADGKINSLDESTEFFDISSPDIQGLLANTRRLAGTPECQWLKTANPNKGEPGLRILAATAGAGGVRQIGRLLIIEKSDAFVNRVSNLITEAKKGFAGGVDVNVHIFSGLGGGTGAGTFLDVCYLVQKALDDIGEGGHALTCGYFFLPDVNLSVPQVAANTNISGYIMPNGFAAMKELDYCMNFETNGGEWIQQYRGFKYGPVKTQPVKCCHLISANTLKGGALEKGYDYAMNVVGDFVLQFLVQNDIDMNTHISNYYNAMSKVPKEHGANYQYILLGASSAVVPMREITTYLASKLFEAFSDSKDRYPSDEEIHQFAKENDLLFQGLLKQVMRGTSYNMPAIELQASMFNNMSESDLATNDLILPEPIMQPYRNMQNKMSAIVEANIQSLTHDWKRDRIQESQDNISRVWKVFYALGDVVADPKKGPFYASIVLNGAGRKNLVDLLDGNLEMIRQQLRNVEGDMALRMKEVKAARTAFLHPGFMKNKKNLFNVFIEALAKYFTDESKIIVLRKMEGMIRLMRGQFTGLYRDYFEPYWSVYKELIDTFHENYNTMSEESVFSSLDDPFVMRLLELDDNMKGLLDKAVEQLDLAQEAKRFNGDFFKADYAWYSKEENKIAKYVSDYVIDVFNEYTQKTITKYLEMRFNTPDQDILQGKIYKEILRPLSDMATPLFWKSPSFNPTEGKLGYISIPGDAAVITTAAQKLIAENKELRLVKSAFANRIFLLRCLCGVPMYGYNGANLYYQKYQSDQAIGKHLYEYTERDPRDWRELSNLQPYSTVEYPSQEMLDNERMYDRAVSLGIVRLSPNGAGREYQLVEYAGIEDIEAAASEAIAKQDLQLGTSVVTMVEEYLQNRQPVKYTNIPNDGSNGNQEKVRKDHVMDSAEMLKAIKEQLRILDRIDEIKESMDRIKTTGSLEGDYRNALFTGVVKFAVPKVTYTKTQYGMSKDIILSDPSTKPYGAIVPLYQGFVSFTGLDDAARSAINKEVETKLNDTAKYYADIKAACDALEATLNDRYMGVMQMQAKKIPDKTALIEEFFINTRVELENFRPMYGIM